MYSAYRCVVHYDRTYMRVVSPSFCWVAGSRLTIHLTLIFAVVKYTISFIAVLRPLVIDLARSLAPALPSLFCPSYLLTDHDPRLFHIRQFGQSFPTRPVTRSVPWHSLTAPSACTPRRPIAQRWTRRACPSTCNGQTSATNQIELSGKTTM